MIDKIFVALVSAGFVLLAYALLYLFFSVILQGEPL